MIEHTPTLPTRSRAISRTVLALGLALAAGCGGSSSPEFATSVPGSIKNNPSTGRAIIVDPSTNGEAAEVRVVKLGWGRLVDVYGLDEMNERVLMQPSFVIGSNLDSDGANFILEDSPVTDRQSLIILRDVTDNAPGGGRKQFFDKLKIAGNDLNPIFDNGFVGVGFYSMVPRNSAVQLQFDDLLDANTITEKTIRVLTGTPSIVPFEARILVDPHYGDLLDRDNDGTAEFYATRVQIDLTVSEIESFLTNPPLPVNNVGLPASIDTNLSNVQIRIPTKINPLLGQEIVLKNLTGHRVTSSNNGSVDFGSITEDVVRAARSGGPNVVTGDPYNGFIRDVTPPRVVGLQGIEILQDPISTNPPPGGDGTEFVLPLIEFNSLFCTQTPDVGDIIEQPGVSAEVIEIPAPAQGNLIANLRVRLVTFPPSWSNGVGPLEWQAAGAGPAQFLSAWDPVADAGKEGCFVQIFPAPISAFVNEPTDDILTSSTIGVRLSEPMDPASVTAFDSLLLTRRETNAVDFSSADYVVGGIQTTLDLKEFTYVPDLPLAHVPPLEESYFFAMQSGGAAPTDLAGNALSITLPQVEMTIAATLAEQINGGRVSRFSAADEEPPFAGVDDPYPFAEWGGQHVYSLATGTIRPRPVVRFQAVADREVDVVGVMAPNPAGVTDPLTSLGSKTQFIWRYVDVGFLLIDPLTNQPDVTLYNVDVEGLNWAPFGGQVVVDTYSEFAMRLNHCFFLPDEIIDPLTLLPIFPNSGLVGVFEDNFLDGELDPQKLVHSRALGYQVNPGDIVVVGQDTKIIPWPMNRTVPPTSYKYYTWRDTALQTRGGPNAIGANPAQWYVVTGEPFPVVPVPGSMPPDCAAGPLNNFYAIDQVQSIALPLLMEFRCYPDDGAIGVNKFDVSLAVNQSTRPFFRAFSSGGINTNLDQEIVDPDLEVQANGGFNPNSTPNPGAPTFGLDQNVYLGAMDLVVRVSRSFSVWQQTVDHTGAELAVPDYFSMTVEPRANVQPQGTRLEFAFRGATAIDVNPGDIEDAGFECTAVATQLDAYGDHYPETPSECDNSINHNATDVLTGAPQVNVPVGFLNGDDSWFEDVTSIDGAQYYQVRVTFVSNTETGLSPALSAFALTWTD